jgi:hypothetical protein
MAAEIIEDQDTEAPDDQLYEYDSEVSIVSESQAFCPYCLWRNDIGRLHGGVRGGALEEGERITINCQCCKQPFCFIFKRISTIYSYKILPNEGVSNER